MKRSLRRNWLSLVTISLVLVSCGSDEEEAFTPKPMGYNHIPVPQHEYVQLVSDNPYTFEYAKNCVPIDDTSKWKAKKENYKILDYPQWKARIHLTYKEINNDPKRLNSLISESHRLAYGHDKKAYGIEDKIIVTKSGTKAMVFELEGEVPSQFQFYTHDSTTHFLRGALYFDEASKNDSLQPLINFMKSDMTHLLNTLEWKNSDEAL